MFKISLLLAARMTCNDPAAMYNHQYFRSSFYLTTSKQEQLKMLGRQFQPIEQNV